MTTWIIIDSLFEDEPCFWSNDIGWVDTIDLATVFTDEERHTLRLPLCAWWRQHEEAA